VTRSRLLPQAAVAAIRTVIPSAERGRMRDNGVMLLLLDGVAASVATPPFWHREVWSAGRILRAYVAGYAGTPLEDRR